MPLVLSRRGYAGRGADWRVIAWCLRDLSRQCLRDGWRLQQSCGYCRLNFTPGKERFKSTVNEAVRVWIGERVLFTGDSVIARSASDNNLSRKRLAASPSDASVSRKTEIKKLIIISSSKNQSDICDPQNGQRRIFVCALIIVTGKPKHFHTVG